MRHRWVRSRSFGAVCALLLMMGCASGGGALVSVAFDPLARFPEHATYAWDRDAIRLPTDPLVAELHLEALIEEVAKVVPIPIIASGGMGSTAHMVSAYEHGADAIAVADMLHYGRTTLPEIRAAALEAQMGVRRDVEIS